MKGKLLVSILLLVSLVLPLGARADVLVPGQKPPRNEASDAFEKLREADLVGWESSYEEECRQALLAIDRLVFWTYPNSGEVHSWASTDWFKGDDILSNSFGPCYRDGEGRLWGYINYIYGRRMAWVCLSDPGNEDIPADAELKAAVEKEVRAVRFRENAPAAGLAAAVVVVTAGIIRVGWRKKQGTTERQKRQ